MSETNSSNETALQILNKDASVWTAEEVQSLADTYREAWQSNDYETLEELTTAMSDIIYGDIEEKDSFWSGESYKRSYQIIPDSDKYEALLGVMNSKEDGDLYYTLNRISLLQSESVTVETKNENELDGQFDYQFEAAGDNTKITLTTSAEGIDKKELYSITAVDMNAMVPSSSVEKLTQIGYTETEIEALKKSALTDGDVACMSSLADRDYLGAYSVDPQELSGLAKLELSTYQVILGRGDDTDLFCQETQNQINTLYNQGILEIERTSGVDMTYAYADYISIISDGLNSQSQLYMDRMQELYQSEGEITDDYLIRGSKLNRTQALWNSFEELNTRENTEAFGLLYSPALNANHISMQVDELKLPEGQDSEKAQYQYEIKIIDNNTGKEAEGTGSLEVKLEQLEGEDIYTNFLMSENRELRTEMENIPKETAINTVMTLHEGILGIPCEGMKETVTAVFDGNLDIKDLSSSLSLVSEFGVGGKAVGIVAGSVKEISSGVEKYQEAEAEIAKNKEYLTVGRNGQVNQMHLWIKAENDMVERKDEIVVAIDGVSPEVQYNMMRWEKEGIDAYLHDIGAQEEGIEGIRDVLNSNINVNEVASNADATVEEVKYAIDAMINGGDFSKISTEVFTEVKIKMNEILENNMAIPKLEGGLNIWMKQRNATASKSEAEQETVMEEAQQQTAENSILKIDSLFMAVKPRLIQDANGNFQLIAGEAQDKNILNGLINGKNLIAQQELTR